MNFFLHIGDIVITAVDINKEPGDFSIIITVTDAWYNIVGTHIVNNEKEAFELIESFHKADDFESEPNKWREIFPFASP